MLIELNLEIIYLILLVIMILMFYGQKEIRSMGEVLEEVLELLKIKEQKKVEVLLWIL